MRPQALRSLASQSSGHLPRKGSREDLQSGRLSRRTTDPAAEAERKAAQEKLFALDMDKVIKGMGCSHLLAIICMYAPAAVPAVWAVSLQSKGLVVCDLQRP